MFNIASLQLKTKLPVLIVAVGLSMSFVVGWIGYADLNTLASEDVGTLTTGILQERKDSVQRYYAEISNNILDVSDGPETLAAFRQLQSGWTALGADPAVQLSEEYIKKNPYPSGGHMALDRAPELTGYNEQHAIFHPTFRGWAGLRGYSDFLLIDLEGDVLYTVDKENDFASNLVSGPEAAGPLAAAFQAAKADPSAVHYSDLAAYGPLAGAPAAFAAKAILGEDGKPIGIVAVRLSDKELTTVVASPISLGASGEVLLVGPDGAARSTSRFDGRFQLLSKLPELPQLHADSKTGMLMMDHVRLTSGDIGTAAVDQVKVAGLDYNVLVEMPDSETYAYVVAARAKLILSTAAAAVVVALIGFFVARSITKPIIRVVGAVKKIAEGDIDSEVVEAGRGDEIGAIAQSLDLRRQKLGAARGMEMEQRRQASAQKSVVDALTIGLRDLSAGNLAQSIDTRFGADYEALRTDFNATVEKLNETISMVIDGAESIRSRSREISQSAEDLSSRTETQAATLEETAAAMDELTASIRTAADGAKEVEQVVSSARSEAEDSGKVVQGAVDAMTEIEKSSDQISQIIGVIDDIAFQTNLLALNAGVEAARAGDSGRGFAVVALEVRALAQRSAAAAKEIKALISNSTQQVVRGVDQVGRAGDALASIVTRVGHISTLVSDIAAAAAEQSTAITEINLGVIQLDQATQQNAAMVEETTAASQSLNQEASGLAELVSQFSVRKIGSMAGRTIDTVSDLRTRQTNTIPVRKTAKRAATKSALPNKADKWQAF